MSFLGAGKGVCEVGGVEMAIFGGVVGMGSFSFLLTVDL
jgi:hypothetical protein